MSTSTTHPESPSAYQPLQPGEDIRLVKIHAAKTNTEVACTILHTSLDQAPPYEAISYTWGNNQDQHRIACGPEGAMITVTANCESVLRRLRLPDEPRLVWIDAICINQAKHVIFDIGEKFEDSEFALFALQRILPNILYKMESGFDIRKSIDHIYERPWFTRVWILQEVFMAREATILCGTTLVPWTVFKPSKIWISSREAGEPENWHVALPSITPNVLSIGSWSNQRYTARKDFLSLLCKGRTCKSTEPRDKVFALYPLIEDAKDKFRADYEKTVETVFIETAIWLALNIGISFLSCIQRNSSFNIPSWVPDWSIGLGTRYTLGLNELIYPLRASLDTKSITQVINLPNQLPELRIRGILVDTIRTITEDINIRTSSTDKDSDRNDTIARAFISEFESHRSTITFKAAKLPRYGSWNPTTDKSDIHPPQWAIRYGLPFVGSNEIRDDDLVMPMVNFCMSRQLFTTTKGHLGVTSYEAKIGDLVCCFLGANVPFILRKVDRGCSEEPQEHFELIDEAYVYGLMEGEALDGLDLSNVGEEFPPKPFQDFHIC